MKIYISVRREKWQAMQQYWKMVGEGLDDAPEMDLQDEMDHKFHPTDPDVAAMWSPPRSE